MWGLILLSSLGFLGLSPLPTSLRFVLLLPFLGAFLSVHLLFECSSFRPEPLCKRIHIILFLLRFCLISVLLFKHFLLAFGFLLFQNLCLCFSIWRLINVILTNDFLSGLVSRLCGLGTALTFAPAFRSYPNVSVYAFLLLFRTFSLLLSGSHAAICRFETSTRVLDGTLLLAALSLLFDLQSL